MYNLIKLSISMEHRPKEIVHNIIRFNVTLEEQVDFISRSCDEKEYVSFLEMIQQMGEKLRVVVTFIAILEMVKNGIIGTAKQPDSSRFSKWPV
jgi:segregation and condensation protein A